MHRGRRPSVIALILALQAWSATGAAEPPTDFEARLEVVRNGKEMGEMVVAFTSGDARWRLESRTHGTRGLAKFIGLEETSVTEGEWFDGTVRTLHFERTVDAIKTFRWSTDFDWQAGVVRSIHRDGESVLELQPGVIDENAIGLRIRTGLIRGESDWHLLVVDEDEIEQQHFALKEVERIETALGCFEGYRVEKVRDPSSTRYTRTWYAAELDFAPVRIEHGKQGDDHMESRLLGITVDGREVTKGPDCPGAPSRP